MSLFDSRVIYFSRSATFYQNQIPVQVSKKKTLREKRENEVDIINNTLKGHRKTGNLLKEMFMVFNGEGKIKTMWLVTLLKAFDSNICTYPYMRIPSQPSYVW